MYTFACYILYFSVFIAGGQLKTVERFWTGIDVLKLAYIVDQAL